MYKKIFSLGLARELLKKGHQIKDIKIDYKYKKQIYLFEWCEKLEKDFTEIKKVFNKD